MVYFDAFSKAVEVMKFSHPSDYGFKTHKDTSPTGRDELLNHSFSSRYLFQHQIMGRQDPKTSLSSQWLCAGRGRVTSENVSIWVCFRSLINVTVI